MKNYTFIIVILAHICNFLHSQNKDLIQDSTHLIILHTNDHHGHPFSFDYRFMKDVGGLAARATIVDNIRSQEKNIVLLDAGDLNSGLISSDFFNANPDIIGYNYIGYDAVVLGNHEFDNGTSVLLEQISVAEFPFISANVKIKHRKDAIKPYIVKEFDGISVGIIGLTMEESENIGYPSTMKEVKVRSELKIAKKYVAELSKKVDIIVVLSHLGWYGETNRGSYRLAREVNNIDLIIDGHTHTKLDSALIVKNKKKNHKTIITQAWCYGLGLGRTDLWIQGDSISRYSFELIPINLQQKIKKADKDTIEYIQKQILEDTSLVRILKPYKDTIDVLFKTPIAQIDTSIDFKSSNKTYNIENVISESMLWYTKDSDVDLSIVNKGSIRNILAKGTVTLENVYSVLPFDNTLYVITMKGSELQKIMVQLNNLPKNKGSSPIFSNNIKFEYDIDNPNIIKVKIDGKNMNKKKVYKVVTTSYLANGGDKYPIPKRISFNDLSVYQRDVLSKYLEKFY